MTQERTVKVVMDIAPKGLGAAKQQIIDMTTAQMKTNLEFDRFGKTLVKNQALFKDLFKQQIKTQNESQAAQLKVNRTLEELHKAANYEAIAEQQGKFAAGTAKLHDKLVSAKAALDPFVSAATIGFAAVNAKVLATTYVFSPAAFERFTWAGKDMAAVIGEMLVPTLEKMTFYVRSVADWIMNIDPGIKKLIGNFATFALVGTGTFLVLSKLLTIGVALTGAVKGLALSFTALSMSTGGILTLVAGVASLAMGWKAASSGVKDYMNENERFQKVQEMNKKIKAYQDYLGPGGSKGSVFDGMTGKGEAKRALRDLITEKNKLSSMGAASSGAGFVGIEEVGRRAQVSAFSSGKSSADQTAENTASTAASVVAMLNLIQTAQAKIASGEAAKAASAALQGLR